MVIWWVPLVKNDGSYLENLKEFPPESVTLEKNLWFQDEFSILRHPNFVTTDCSCYMECNFQPTCEKMTSLADGFKHCFYFHPYLGKMNPNLTFIFFTLGWNHQPDDILNFPHSSVSPHFLRWVPTGSSCSCMGRSWGSGSLWWINASRSGLVGTSRPW